MRPNEHSKDYLHGLDGWRAVAISLVLIDHSQSLPPVLHSIQGGGGLGVRIFFAISGLLICTRMLQEESKFGRISLPNFYVRRVFRILPAALLFLGVLAVLGALAVVPFQRAPWFSALLFYRNYYTCYHGVSPAGWFTAHFWSLSVEEHFYLLLPFILVFFRRQRIQVLCVLIAVSLAAGFVYVAHTADPNDINWTTRTEYCIVSLLIPAVYALLLRHQQLRGTVTRWLSPWVGLVLGAMCVTRFIHPFSTMAADGLWSLILKSVLFPLMLLGTVLHPHSVVTRVLDAAPLRFVGRISYSLYLWQALFLTRAYTYPRYPIHHLQHPLIGITCTFACAVASYYGVERPAIALGRRFTHSLPIRSVPESTPVHAS